jgi:hypothetical protein
MISQDEVRVILKSRNTNYKDEGKVQLEARADVEAAGAGGAIKKDNHALLKLPELGKIYSHTTYPLSNKFTLASVGDNDYHLPSAYRMSMRLVKIT